MGECSFDEKAQRCKHSSWQFNHWAEKLRLCWVQTRVSPSTYLRFDTWIALKVRVSVGKGVINFELKSECIEVKRVLQSSCVKVIWNDDLNWRGMKVGNYK